MLTVAALSAQAQQNTREATLKNLTEKLIIAFHIDNLTIQGMTEKDTLFIKNAQNYVFKKDDSEKIIGGYQYFQEASFHHPYFNTDVLTQDFYDGDAKISDVYSTMEVSRTTVLKDSLEPVNFESIRGSLIALLNILQSKGFETVHQKDTIIFNKNCLYMDALSNSDTIRHELLIDKSVNLPVFLRITTNTFQPFIEEYTYSSFAYPDSFEKPESMRQPIKNDIQQAKPLTDGAVIPDWKLNTLSGKSFSFEDLKGKKTILYVSMINCGPCQTAVPFIDKLIEKYKNNPEVNIVVFYPYDSKDNLEKYVKTKEIAYAVVYNSSENETERIVIMNNMQMPMPTFLILDKDNKIASRVVGFNIDYKDKIEASIEEKLKDIL